jgi:hypothetical protein
MAGMGTQFNGTSTRCSLQKDVLVHKNSVVMVNGEEKLHKAASKQIKSKQTEGEKILFFFVVGKKK